MLILIIRQKLKGLLLSSVEFKNKNYEYLMEAAIGGARAARFKSLFKPEFQGNIEKETASNKGYDYYTILP